MIDAFQRATYEAFAAWGPETAAVLAGFAVLWLGELHLTPAGERYLEENCE